MINLKQSAEAKKITCSYSIHLLQKIQTQPFLFLVGKCILHCPLLKKVNRKALPDNPGSPGGPGRPKPGRPEKETDIEKKLERVFSFQVFRNRNMRLRTI